VDDEPKDDDRPSIVAAPTSLPWLTTEQMIEVDRIMMDDLGIGLAQMMESAGRDLAQLTRVRFLDGDPRCRRVVVLAGPGGNGGGALVAARRLHGWGADVTVVTSSPRDRFAGAPAEQLDRVDRLGIERHDADHLDGLRPFDVVLDGVIGYSLTGAPRGSAATLIAAANWLAPAVLSLDVPSGLDTTTGQVHDPVVRATATLTLALPKIGLLQDGARSVVGELYLGDIGVPAALYSAPSLGLDVGAVFAAAEILRIW
jgi:NAD(P)H-hydrate epimerase